MLILGALLCYKLLYHIKMKLHWLHHAPETPGLIRQESPVWLHQVVSNALVHLVTTGDISPWMHRKKQVGRTGWNLLKPVEITDLFKSFLCASTALKIHV